jgi:hypothetical protein
MELLEIPGNGVTAELWVGVAALGAAVSSPQAPKKIAEPTKADNRIFLEIIKSSLKLPKRRGLVNAKVIYINIAIKENLKEKIKFTCEHKHERTLYKKRAACATLL